ncbi:MAG: hypothetical protein V2G42_04050 [bacterium JZ-2024 1]
MTHFPRRVRILIILPLFLISDGGVLVRAEAPRQVSVFAELRQQTSPLFLAEGLHLLPEFISLANGDAILPASSSSAVAFSVWHPAAGAFGKPSIFYSHSLRHFPRDATVTSGGKRSNVDQLDADLVIYNRRALWGTVTLSFSVSGEWGFDHHGQDLPGFLKRRADGRLNGVSYARKILPWFVFGWGHSSTRFRGFAAGLPVGKWTLTRRQSGHILRIFPWLTVALSRHYSHMAIAGFVRNVASVISGNSFIVRFSVLPWISTVSVLGENPGRILRSSIISAGPVSHGRYLYISTELPVKQYSGRIASIRLTLPGVTLRYGEASSALPVLLFFPSDWPENISTPVIFKDIHIGSVAFPN